MNTIPWSLRSMLLINLVLCAVTFRQWVAVGVVGLLLMLGSFVPWRIELDRIGQMIVSLSALVVTYVLVVGIGPPPKHPISNGFALAQAFVCVWVLLVCGFRLFFSAPYGGHRGTVFLGLAGIFACGGFKVGYMFHGFVFAFFGFALWAMVEVDPSRPSVTDASSKRFRLSAAALGIAGAVALSMLMTLPMTYSWLSRQLGLNWIHRRQTGFDRYFRLGSLQNMIQSKRVALRVHAQFQSSIRLRGLVYNRYYNRYWLVPRKFPAQIKRVPKKLAQHLLSKNAIRIEYVAGDSNRYFVPLRSSQFALPERRIRIDRMGLVLPLEDKNTDTLSFIRGRTSTLSVAPPEKGDLQVPAKLRLPIQKLAQKWIGDATTPRQKIHALARKLRSDFTYSLSFKRPAKRSPLLYFLQVDKKGHCEYFASSLALLGRSVGVPIRVVTGYLASEYNPWGQYYIVREQNAHAWVEAWIPKKGWVTFDATPAGGIAQHMPKRSSWSSGMSDLLFVYMKRFRLWLAARSIGEMSVGIGAFFLLWIAIRVVRRMRNQAKLNTQNKPLYDEPIPVLVEMLETLHSDLPMQSNETLEHYARRLGTSEASEHIRLAAPIILDYAAFRYGRIGSQEGIETSIREWIDAEPASENSVR